jgi:ADP-heptose:LPS heptosyltransferase
LKKILIIQTAFIGDVILATPIIENLKISFPNALVDFMLRKGNEKLFDSHPKLNQVIIWDKQNGKYKNLFLLIKKIRTTKYDLVINVQRFAASGLMTLLSGATKKIGFSKNPFSFSYTYKYQHEIGNNKHEVDRNNLLLKEICNTPFHKPMLYPSVENYASIKKYQSNDYICVAPASVWFTKQLPKKKWVDLINKQSSLIKIFMLGGNSDFDLCNDIISQAKMKNCINLCGKLSFLESAALMKSALMNYTNDSAPLHIASAMNANVTVFYCSTIPAFGFGPLSDSSKIIETTIDLKCRPCGLHGFKKCPEDHFQCAHTIEII